MHRHAGYLVGVIFGGLSSVFLLNSLNLTEEYGSLYASLSILTFLFSVLTGRKIAALTHDAHVLNLRASRAISMQSALSLLILFFLMMLIVMTLFTTLIIRSVQAVDSTLFSSINTFIYSNSALFASYFLFKERYSGKKDTLVSAWGRRAESIFSLKREITDSSKEYIKNGLSSTNSSISRISSVFSGNRGQP